MTIPRVNLDEARVDLAAVANELHALTAAKSDASRSAASFGKWRADHDAKAAERDRLTALIETLERESAVVESTEAEAAMRRRYAAKVTANAKLAQRIKTDLARANSILLALVCDVAEAADDAAINAALPDDLEPLTPADFIARGRPGLDRKELKKTRVMLWVNARGGDQDAVADRGNGLGRIGEGAYVVTCSRALFEQIEYFPAEPAERPQALWQLRLPQPDGPGLAFDGAKCNYPADVVAELARAARVGEPRERPTEIELRPVPSIAADEQAAA